MSAIATYAKSDKVAIFPFSSTRGDAKVYQASESRYVFSTDDSSDDIYLTTKFVTDSDLAQEISTLQYCVRPEVAGDNIYTLSAGTYYVVVKTTRKPVGDKITVSFHIEGTNERHTCEIPLKDINNSGTYKGQCPVYISTIVTKTTFELDSFSDYRSNYEEVILESIENRSRVLSEGNLMTIISSLTEKSSFVTHIDLDNSTIEFVMAGHYFKLTDANLVKSTANLWARIVVCGPSENRVLLGADRKNEDEELVFDGIHLFTEEPDEESNTEFSHVMNPNVFDLQLLSNGEIPFSSQCRFDNHGITHLYGGTC